MGSRARFALVGCALLAGLALVASRALDRTAADAAGPGPEPLEGPLEKASDDPIEPKPELAPAAATPRVPLEAPKSSARIRSTFSAENRLEPRADEALLRVLVVAEETSAPLAAARLSLMHAGEGGGTHVDRARARLNEVPRTGEDGWGEFIVPEAKEFEVSASWGDSHGAEHVPALARGATYEVTLRLPTQDDFVVFCRVVDAEDGNPLREASVQLQSGSGYEPPVPAGAGGLFELSGASWRNDVARAQARGFADRYFYVVAGHSSPAEAFEVRLPRVASLSARVTGSSGLPVAGAQVFLSTSRFNLYLPESTFFLWNLSLGEEDPSWIATTGNDGRCTLEDLPPSTPLSMELRLQGSPNQPEPALTLQPGEAREIELVVGGGVELRGVLMDQFREPVPGQRIVLLRPDEFGHPCRILIDGLEDTAGETTTDARGRFTIPNVSEGSWLIGPSPRDPPLRWVLNPGLREAARDRDADERRLACVAIPIEVGRVSPQEIELRADRGLYIHGRVLGSNGTPADAYVVGMWTEGLLVGTLPDARTQDGIFALGPLPAGRWRLTASAENGDADSDPVLADAGERDVLLRLKAGCSLQGEVVDSSTGLRRPAEVAYHARGQDYMSWASADDAGFTIEGLGAGTYALFARAGDKVGWLADVDLAPGEERTGLRIFLGPGATLRLINRSARSGYCGVVLDDYRIDGFPTEAGKEATAVLPSGHAKLHLYLAPDLQAVARTIDVDLVAGEEREVSFEDER